MRKLKLQVQVSADGYMGGPNGELDWMTWNWDERLKEFAGKLTDPIETILLGRKMTDGFVNHWKKVAADPSDPSYSAGKKFTETPKVVFSRSLKQSQWENTDVSNGPLDEEINKLKRQGGGDIMVYGGAEFVSNLAAAGLIDDYYLFVNPVTLGRGFPVFKSRMALKLVEADSFECGIVMLHYQAG